MLRSFLKSLNSRLNITENSNSGGSPHQSATLQFKMLTELNCTIEVRSAQPLNRNRCLVDTGVNLLDSLINIHSEQNRVVIGVKDGESICCFDRVPEQRNQHSSNRLRTFQLKLVYRSFLARPSLVSRSLWGGNKAVATFGPYDARSCGQYETQYQNKGRCFSHAEDCTSSTFALLASERFYLRSRCATNIPTECG
jgi:hypothetical protein